ncbi:hypothetical protein VC83_07898 [Pseudogymnoascus destructans]|uniref:60S ribosomal protein L41 n=1 Tax=Pseudogymnoascus destructans TaxID=655981 RepID=A0A177A0J9_9PEZI|nr:uncharacterized protein VC83_07898 [Pseudogymnoascus destructans]OAF55795.1 hypothetical protein VC83_07898 [Pseudogymnoascus destructans]
MADLNGDLGSKLPLAMVVRNDGDATNVKAPDERRYGKLKSMRAKWRKKRTRRLKRKRRKTRARSK